jgi:hypothetical protein
MKKYFFVFLTILIAVVSTYLLPKSKRRSALQPLGKIPSDLPKLFKKKIET